MGQDQSRTPQDLSGEERRRLRSAHGRLRTASQELEALVATEPIRGRWDPEPAPAEILAAARDELHRAYEVVVLRHREILGWEPPEGAG